LSDRYLAYLTPISSGGPFKLSGADLFLLSLKIGSPARLPTRTRFEGRERGNGCASKGDVETGEETQVQIAENGGSGLESEAGSESIRGGSR